MDEVAEDYSSRDLLGVAWWSDGGMWGLAGVTRVAGATRIGSWPPGSLASRGAVFPAVTWIAAHFGWPWFMECLAIALHASNVWIELSGWAPKYLPAEVVREIGRRLNAQTVFGSDYPFTPLDRWFSEFEELGLSAEAQRAILIGNASRLLGIEIT